MGISVFILRIVIYLSKTATVVQQSTKNPQSPPHFLIDAHSFKQAVKSCPLFMGPLANTILDDWISCGDSFWDVCLCERIRCISLLFLYHEMSWYAINKLKITNRHKKQKGSTQSHSTGKHCTSMSITKAGRRVGTYYYVSSSRLSWFFSLLVGKQWNCDIVAIGCKLDGLLREPWLIVLFPIWFITFLLFSIHCWNGFITLIHRRRKEDRQRIWTMSTLYVSVILFEVLWVLWLDNIRDIQLLVVVSPLCIWGICHMGELVILLFKSSNPRGDDYTTRSTLIDLLFVITLLITAAITYDYVNLIPNYTPPIILLFYIVFKLIFEVVLVTACQDRL